jgi:signal peptidase I
MHYSYRAQKHQRYRLLKFILVILIFFILYNCLTAFFFSVWVVDNNTMQPTLTAGDRLIFTSFSPPAFLSRNKNSDNVMLFKRGSIVLVDMGGINNQKLPFRIIDSIVRFLTLQQYSIFQEKSYYIKRVIALPGDEISMSNYTFRVKTKDNLYSLTEFELSEKPYHPFIRQNPAIWDASLPFSGSMEPVILGPDECFVVSDDRSNTNDSRTWGAISSTIITARAVLRFWPFKKIELL